MSFQPFSEPVAGSLIFPGPGRSSLCDPHTAAAEKLCTFPDHSSSSSTASNGRLAAGEIREVKPGKSGNMI
jgi:hypothetical protein